MSSDNELDAMTDEQAAEQYYRHRDEIERELGEPVDIESARPLSLVVSVRLREDEAEQVGAASEAAGMKVSTFIRQAAVAAATRDEPLDREALARRLASVRRAVDDVEQLVQRRPSSDS
ncbi:MAG: plasmid mobilization protein [Pseudonocardiaceae bacterium]